MGYLLISPSGVLRRSVLEHWVVLPGDTCPRNMGAHGLLRWLFSFQVVAACFHHSRSVSPDSPQFSTLVAQYAPPHLRGTALTIYNSIGFTITIISLIVFDRLLHSKTLLSGSNTFAILALGALTGLPFIYSLTRRTTNSSSEIPKS